MNKPILLTMAILVSVFGTQRSFAQGDSLTTKSESSTIDVRVFAPKYKERIETYAGQIKMDLSNGFLSTEQAADFNSRLDGLRKLDADASAHAYSNPWLDDEEKAFTTFNIDLAKASSTHKSK